MLAIILSNVVALRLDNLYFPSSNDASCQVDEENKHV